MRSEVFKVISHFPNGKKIKIWDAASPMAIDHHHEWILEKGHPQPRIRSLRIHSESSNLPKVILAQPDVSENRFTFELPNSHKIELVRLNGIYPAYHRFPVASHAKDQALAVYAGSGRGLIQFSVATSSFVAYARSKPIFSLQTSVDGFHIRPLLPGLRLKLKNQKSTLGQVGQSWSLNADQISECTLFRSSRWWKFAFISEQLVGQISSTSHLGENLTETKFFRNLVIGLTLALCIGGALISRMPTPAPVIPEKQEEPIVKFYVPPKKQHREEISQSESQPKPIKVEPVKTKPVDQKPKEIKPKPELQNKTPPKGAAAPVQKAPPSTQNESTAKIAALKNVFGGALKLTGKPSNLSINAPNAAGGLLKGNGNTLKPTEVVPKYSGKTAKFDGIGGTPGGVASYGTQEGGIVGKSKGGSFVAFNDAGMAVEKGLLPEEVGAVIHAHMAEIRYCHEASLLYQPNLSGRVVVQFSIDPTGKVEKANVQSSSVNDGNLEKCIVSKLVTWKFPKPKGGTHVTVSYPFAFKVLDKE